MDRSSRRTGSRLSSHPNSTSPPPSTGEAPFGPPSSMSPLHKSHSWHQVSQPHPTSLSARRNSRPSSHHDFSFSTPDSFRDSSSRRKSKAADGLTETPAAAATTQDGDADDGPTKGGHSLRRRARINYASEQIEDEPLVPNSSSLSRFKKRRPDGQMEDSSEDSYGVRPKRRGTSLGLETPSSRRRNPSRKSVESQTYIGDVGHDENLIHTGMPEEVVDEVHDTIQVGNWSSTSSTPPSSKSEIKNGLSNQFGSPDRDEISQDYPGIDPSMETPSKTSRPAVPKQESSPMMDPALIESANGYNQGIPTDPSLQLQMESIESRDSHQDYPEDASVNTFDPPSHGPLARNTQSSPVAPNHRQDGTSFTYSPQPYEETSAMDLDTKDNTDFAEGNQQSDAPLPVDPALMDPQLTMGQEPTTAAKNAEVPEIALHDDTAKSSPTAEDGDIAVDSAPSPKPKDEQNEESKSVSDPAAAVEKSPSLDPETPTETIERDVPEDDEPTTEVAGSEKPAYAPIVGTRLKEELVMSKTSSPDPRWCRPQPTPVGKWSHLTPYVNGEYTVYPEKKPRSDDDDASEDQSPEDKDSVREGNDPDGNGDNDDDGPDGLITELTTPALNTPTRGSPVPEAIELSGLNSPGPAGEEPEDPDVSESQEILDRKKHYRYRKLRDPEEFVAAIENYEDMSTEELYDALQAINLSLVGWQDEWTALGKLVDDYENSSRRRIADAKYETRTRNLHQHGLNHEEPEFGVRGYKAKEKETMSETRYLQAQDRIMAAAYGFEYDPHPSKIGRQNPETQQAGVTTRGRSLRNQPKQTVKASEADGVTGKRHRKPVQLFDPAPQDVSRASTPVPQTRGGRRRKTANADEDAQVSFASSFNEPSDGETPATTGPGRRKRGPKPRNTRGFDEPAPTNGTVQETPKGTGRRGRPRIIRDDDFGVSHQTPEVEQPRSEPRQHRGRHMLTLKIPKGKDFSQPSSAISDNGDSRPSTASSDSTTHTAESSYSFRPKRQKRFRDEPDEAGAVQAPPKKRNRRTGPNEDKDSVMNVAEPMTPASVPTPAAAPAAADHSNNSARKAPKIKVMRPSAGQTADNSRNGTPVSQPATEGGGDDQPKEYKTMTKSEKMSASMKNRWANGNMAGAVEKRKATLAAKKAAQAAAEQRIGLLAPKPKGKMAKKETLLPGENAVFIHSSSSHPQGQRMPPAPGPPPGPPAHAVPIPRAHGHAHAHGLHHHAPHPPPPPHHHQLPPHQMQHQHQFAPPPPPPHHQQRPPHPHHPHHHPHHARHEYPGMGAPFPS